MYVVTDFWSGTERPYLNKLRRSEDDWNVAAYQALDDAIEKAGAVDGDEIEIIVRKTGRRPFGDRRVTLVEPHIYRRQRRKR